MFGQKDYQQLLVIQRMTRDLCLPIEILAAPTLREANGLAMSSRNQYLTAEERERAGIIHTTLNFMREALAQGRPLATIQSLAREALQQAGLVPDYATLRRTADLSEPALRRTPRAHRTGCREIGLRTPN